MSVVFAVTNQKGGVGKTTTAVSLAAAFAARGMHLLLVDSDPAGERHLRHRGRKAAADGLYEALVGERVLDGAVVPTDTTGLWLVPTTPSLAGAEVELASVTAREFRMKRALEPLRDRYDFVIIDCPPSLGLLTVNALAAADEVIIPVQTEYLALEGLSHLSQTIELVRRNLNPSLRVRGILLTMFDGRTNLARQVEEEVRRHFDHTFHAVIPRSVRLSEAPSHGEPIQRYDPLSAGARAYEAFAESFYSSYAQQPRGVTMARKSGLGRGLSALIRRGSRPTGESPSPRSRSVTSRPTLSSRVPRPRTPVSRI